MRFILSLFKDTGGTNTKAPADFRPVYDVEALKNCAGRAASRRASRGHREDSRQQRALYFRGRQDVRGQSQTVEGRDIAVHAASVLLAQHLWIEEWCRANSGYTLYGEVVPTQGGYNYGCKDGETKFFVFDILSPDGKWVNSSQADIASALIQDVEVFAHWDTRDLQGTRLLPASVLPLADGITTTTSTVPAPAYPRRHRDSSRREEREARNLGRVQLKVVSNAFLEKEPTSDSSRLREGCIRHGGVRTGRAATTLTNWRRLLAPSATTFSPDPRP